MRLSNARIRVNAAAVLLAFSLVTPSAVWAKDGEALSNIAIGNFGRINPNFYRGAQPKGHDFVDLAALGVKTVIDLTPNGWAGESDAAKAAGMKFFRIPLTTQDRPTPEAIDQFLKLVNDPTNQPVFVHCQGGRHRTGVMTALYRLTHDRWSADRAYAEMKRYEFDKGFGHGALKSLVYDYYAHLDHAAPVQ